MRIKRSHLEALHFVTGTLFTCALVVSVSLNLQAHPLVKMLDQPAKITVGNTTSTPSTKSACETKSEVRDLAMTELDNAVSSDFKAAHKRRATIEPEIASMLAPPDLSLNESIDEAMNDDCAKELGTERASEQLNDKFKQDPKATTGNTDEEINSLLNEIESALNPVPVEKSCEDLTPLYDIPAVSWAQSLAVN